MTRRTYTLYLAKEPVEQFEELLTEYGKRRLEEEDTQIIDSEAIGTKVRLIIFRGQAMTPKWMEELKRVFNFQDVKTNSACALMMFEESGRTFAANFAHGWMYLNEAMLEPDFGLKVSINALDETRIKRLERANLGDALREVSLSPFHREFNSFAIDDALDLVRKIGGSVRDENLTDEASINVMTGARSLRIAGEFSLSDLPRIARGTLEFFQSEEYKQTSFRIFDFVRQITDPALIQHLDNIAADRIRDGAESLELGLPTTREHEGVSYTFKGPGSPRHYPEILLRNYAAWLGERLSEITAQSLKDHRIVTVFEDSAIPEQHLPIRNALVGSVDCGNQNYAVNEGEWYQIEEQFMRSVQRTFDELIQDWPGNSQGPLERTYDETPNERLKTEADYNSALSSELGYVHMDRCLIQIPDAQARPFEACDLLDIANKRFIHVKRSSRRSSLLSHFFKQGSNSAQHFKRFHSTWQALADKIEQEADRKTRDEFDTAMKDQAKNWRVEFWIIDSPRKNGEFDIPFFSKISLRDESNRLKAMNYEVGVRFIDIQPGQT